MELKNAREKYEEGKIDAWEDKVWVRHIVKTVQSVDPGIGAVLFPETKQIVFYWNRIIIYKVWMDKHNVDDTSLEEHKKKVQQVVTGIKMGLINIKPFQKQMTTFNKHKTGKLL